MDFLQSLSGVNDLQANIKDLKTELTEVATEVSNIEGDYFQLAQKSMAIKQSYFDVSKSILDFKATRGSHLGELLFSRNSLKRPRGLRSASLRVS